MLKWKLEQTLADIDRAIYRHTHNLDRQPDTSDYLEQEYITKKLIELRDLITLLWEPDTSKKIKVKKGTAQDILNTLGITEDEFNEAKKRL